MWNTEAFHKNFLCRKTRTSQDGLPRCKWLLSETTWCFCLENKHSWSPPPPALVWARVTTQRQSLYKMHVDSCAASGPARYDYFSGRAIEQQHGAITNIFFVHSPCELNLCHVISLSSYLAHTCGQHERRVRMHDTCRRKQIINSKRLKRKRQTMHPSSWCVMCIPLERRLKRRSGFSTSKAACWGIPLRLSAFLTCSIPSSFFHE